MSVWKAFGRGFDSRRLHQFFLLLIFLISVPLFAQEDRLLVFDGARKVQIPLQKIEGIGYIRIADLQPFFDLQLNPIGNQNLSVSMGQHSIILSANRVLVSIDEKLVSLNQPAYLVQGTWYVPLDFIQKVLKTTSEKRFLWLPNSQSLILGDIQPNQLVLKYSKDVDHSRLVFQSLRPLDYSVVQQNNAVIVTPQEEDFVLEFRDSNFEDGVLLGLTVQTTGERKSFRIDGTKDFASIKSFELSDPPRLVVDFYRAQPGAAAAPPAEQPHPASQTPPPQVPPTLLPSTASAKRVIVIDPGHGGTETGAKGPDGTFEKDIVMNIARKLKGLVEANTDMRAILTRDGDQLVPLDDRTSLANNNKADLFISIHANATIRGFAKGAETYFLSAQATDDETRNIAAVENNAIGINQNLSGVDTDLKLILWDMAQTEYLAESSQLAETIQQELNSTLAISDRGIKQAPFRVLMGATMPAVLVEVGFINNPAEEKLMEDNDYQSKIASAIFRSIQKFQSTRNQQANEIQPTAGKNQK